MANNKHVALLKKGAEAWNAWRRANPKVSPDLFGAALFGADLSNADLRGADLSYANLGGADLFGATLRGATLTQINLTYANLRGTGLSEADLPHSAGCLKRIKRLKLVEGQRSGLSHG